MKKNILVGAIFFLGLLLRFWQLGMIPASLTWDEVAWGYNAYSIGIDGRDEFGRFLPLNYLESFGDYKPPMYAYLGVLPIKFFGLTGMASRVPSALFGSLTVLVTFFLVLEIFRKSQRRYWYALVAELILAVSPWHSMLSRATFEANVSTFFIVCGVWLFIRAMQQNPWYVLLSVTSFIFSIYTFNTARVVSPLLLGVLCLMFAKTLVVKKKQTFTALLLGVVLTLPILPFLLSPQARLRYQEVNIFSDPALVTQSNTEVARDGNTWWAKILHNRRPIYAAAYIHHYLDNLTPKFLFITGDGNPKFSIQDTGELYLWDLPFLIVGILFLVRRKEGVWWIIPLWLLLGIIPAATARETPHALRTEAALPTFQILIAYGFVEIVAAVKKKRSLVLGSMLFLLFLSVVAFQHSYYAHYAREYAGEWQYGYKDALFYTTSVEHEYSRIEFTDALGRPYIYYLFYAHMSPLTFRKTSDISRDVFGFVSVTRVGKYYFAKDFPVLSGKVLYVNVPSQIPSNAHILKTFALPNGIPSLVAYTL